MSDVGLDKAVVGKVSVTVGVQRKLDFTAPFHIRVNSKAQIEFWIGDAVACAFVPDYARTFYLPALNKAIETFSRFEFQLQPAGRPPINVVVAAEDVEWHRLVLVTAVTMADALWKAPRPKTEPLQ